MGATLDRQTQAEYPTSRRLPPWLRLSTGFLLGVGGPFVAQHLALAPTWAEGVDGALTALILTFGFVIGSWAVHRTRRLDMIRGHPPTTNPGALDSQDGSRQLVGSYVELRRTLTYVPQAIATVRT